LYLYSGVREEGWGVLSIIFVCFLSSCVPCSLVLARRLRRLSQSRWFDGPGLSLGWLGGLALWGWAGCALALYCGCFWDLCLDLDAMGLDTHATSLSASHPFVVNPPPTLPRKNFTLSASHPRHKFSFEIPSRRLVDVVRVGMVAPSVSRSTADLETP
jgi:hypothetical protein